ncbi:MAG: tRNA (adenosine(37)-N6)-threonylcarbamoyltransferase complex ATPase subunit type 1 TsaE [Chloroflexi bacterium]|nr:tRNA (adenosine(37)-N6)-threonylcarbamoyltransferase complex ATPase subunit type 1 TsaE [Chloroflexota bacterium]
MVTCISKSPDETIALGAEWGRTARLGWIIGLTGDLGAGKTQLVKGLARGLGVTERVHSPTFTLLNQYVSGRVPLFHLDLYRLETRSQIIGAGLEEYFFHPPGLAVIEWMERWLGPLQRPECHGSEWPAPFRYVQIEMLSGQERRITYEDFGA